MTAVQAGSVGMALLLAALYLVYGFFVLYVIVQMILRLALTDLLLALAPIALGLWILPHPAGWGRQWLRLFMTTVFQQAIQLIALALGFGFLREFAAIAAFEPVQDLIWKLLMSLAFVYHGDPGAVDAWQRRGPSTPGSRCSMSAMNLPLLDGQVGQDHRADSGRGRRRTGRHGGGGDGGQRGPVGRGERPQLGGFYGHPIGRRGRRRRSPPEQRRVAPTTTTPTECGRGLRPSTTGRRR